MLEYFALFLVFFVFLVLFYGIIVVHEIPYEIAVKRNHPQKEAIHVAGWISLFTIGAIWPFLWIWASLNKESIAGPDANNENSNDQSDDVAALKIQVSELQKSIESLKATKENN